jgi:hypothetical protein
LTKSTIKDQLHKGQHMKELNWYVSLVKVSHLRPTVQGTGHNILAIKDQLRVGHNASTVKVGSNTTKN